MDNFFSIVLIIVIGLVVYQLYRRNQIELLKIQRKNEEREQAEKDEFLKQEFPHIFLRLRNEIREYWKKIQEYDPRYSDCVDYSDEVGSWEKIEGISNEDFTKAIQKMNGIWYEEFEEKAVQREINQSELNFMDDLFWKVIYETHKDSPKGFIESAKRDSSNRLVKGRLEGWLSFFPKK